MSPRILAVDDHEDNRRIFHDALTMAGYEVIEAVDAPEALRLAEAEAPDLILMDIRLPGMDGYEAMRRLRGHPRLSGVLIIVVTSDAMPGDRELAFDAGCDDYMSKPVSPRALLARIRELLATRRARAPIAAPPPAPGLLAEA